MNGQVQLPTRTAFVLGIVLLTAVACTAAGSDAVLLPVIDRDGDAAYCRVATEAIDAAESSIDLLLSTAELVENPLVERLIAAHNRGVLIRVLLDASAWAPSISEKNRPTADYLQSMGIEARLDDPEITLHAKLLVVDRRVVLIGSTNWNRYAFTEHVQANLLVECLSVGEAFADYFDRLWENRLAPEGVELDLEALEAMNREEPLIVPLCDTEGTATYADLLLRVLSGAEASVHVVIYRVSIYPGYQDSLSNAIVDAVVAAAGRGLDVRVLIDDCRFYPDSAEANLTSALSLHQRGVPVRFDAPETTTHAKLVIVDGKSVILGSTNWNYYALERNIEASIAVLGVPSVAAAFEEAFERLWAEGREIGP